MSYVATIPGPFKLLWRGLLWRLLGSKPVSASEATRITHQLAQRIVAEVRSPGTDDEKALRVSLMIRGEL